MSTATAKPLNQWDISALKTQLANWKDQYTDLSKGNLKLDLSRGKPGIEQISLSDGLDGILEGNFITASNQLFSMINFPKFTIPLPASIIILFFDVST